MKIIPLPTPQYLNECFAYNEDTGILTWKVRPLSHFKNSRAMKSSNTQRAGKVVGTVICDMYTSYLATTIDGIQYKAHRLILQMYSLFLDEGSVVDHLDGNGSNNRLDNLQAVSNTSNSKRKRLASNNVSGTRGVYFDKPRNQWRARIKVEGEDKHLGRFSCKEQAIEARNIAEKEFGYVTINGPLSVSL